LSPHRVKEILAAQSAAPTVKQGPLGKFTDLLALYQALSLVVPMQPDLEIDPDLQVRAPHSITALLDKYIP
jgi:hypothetical protein